MTFVRAEYIWLPSTFRRLPRSRKSDTLAGCRDLAICTPSSLHFLNSFRRSDLRNSDHFPLFISIVSSMDIPISGSDRFICERADSIKFTYVAVLTEPMVDQNVKESVKTLTQMSMRDADSSIPKSLSRIRNKCKPWWNEECTDAVKNKNLQHLLEVPRHS